MKLLTSTQWGKSKKTYTKKYSSPSSNTLTPFVTHHLIHLSQQTPKNKKCSFENPHGLHPRHQHLHSETKIFPLQTPRVTTHTKSLTSIHPLHPLTTQKANPRYKKQSKFNNNNYTLNKSCSQNTSHAPIKYNLKTKHKNSTRINIIHSQQNSQQTIPTYTRLRNHPRSPHSMKPRPTQIKQMTFHPFIPRQNLTTIPFLTIMPTLTSSLSQNKYLTEI